MVLQVIKKTRFYPKDVTVMKEQPIMIQHIQDTQNLRLLQTPLLYIKGPMTARVPQVKNNWIQKIQQLSPKIQKLSPNIQQLRKPKNQQLSPKHQQLIMMIMMKELKRSTQNLKLLQTPLLYIKGSMMARLP